MRFWLENTLKSIMVSLRWIILFVLLVLISIYNGYFFVSATTDLIDAELMEFCYCISHFIMQYFFIKWFWRVIVICLVFYGQRISNFPNFDCFALVMLWFCVLYCVLWFFVSFTMPSILIKTPPGKACHASLQSLDMQHSPPLQQLSQLGIFSNFEICCKWFCYS